MKTFNQVREYLKETMSNPVLLAYVGAEERRKGRIHMLQTILDETQPSNPSNHAYYNNGTDYFAGMYDSLRWWLNIYNNNDPDGSEPSSKDDSNNDNNDNNPDSSNDSSNDNNKSEKKVKKSRKK